MDVSVILVNYNTKDLTIACIESIFENTTNLDFEVILVDNDSADGSNEIFSKDSRITYINAGDNLGFGKANNLGLEHAKGKYIFFLNTDTLLGNNAIKLFFEKMEELPSDVGCLGTILLDANGEKTHSYGQFPTIFNQLKSNTLLSIYKKFFKPKRKFPNEELFPVEYITGADLFVRKSVIDKLGAFDKDFFMYYEETDMQRRYTSHGYRSYIFSKPIIYHFQGGSATGVKLSSQLIYRRGQITYMKKNLSKINFRIYQTLSFLLGMPLFLYFVIKSKHKFHEKIKFLKSAYDLKNI